MTRLAKRAPKRPLPNEAALLQQLRDLALRQGICSPAELATLRFSLINGATKKGIGIAALDLYYIKRSMFHQGAAAFDLQSLDLTDFRNRVREVLAVLRWSKASPPTLKGA